MKLSVTLLLGLALGVQGDSQPKVVEKSVKELRTTYDANKEHGSTGEIETCADKARVLLHRENGEAICVSFEAIQPTIILRGEASKDSWQYVPVKP